MQSVDEDTLLKTYFEIWRLLEKAGQLVKWLSLLSESMGLESETRRLRISYVSLRNIRSSIGMVCDGISTKLENKLNEEEKRERERREKKEEKWARIHGRLNKGEGL